MVIYLERKVVIQRFQNKRYFNQSYFVNFIFVDTSRHFFVIQKFFNIIPYHSSVSISVNYGKVVLADKFSHMKELIHEHFQLLEFSRFSVIS